MEHSIVNVIGLGYIGLPTALMMASHGVKVVGTDYNGDLVASLKRGELTFEEAGLEELATGNKIMRPAYINILSQKEYIPINNR